MKNWNTAELKGAKNWGRLILIGLSIAILFLGYSATKLEFDYDFEKFFPKDNSDLAFFKEFRDRFENDNDFVFIGLKNEKGILDQAFLEKSQTLVKELKGLPHIREVISPHEMKYFALNSSGIGLREMNYFSKTDSGFVYDSVQLFNEQEPVSQLLSSDGKSLIIVIKNVQIISKVKSDELAIALKLVLDKYTFDDMHVMGKIIGQKVYLEIMQTEFLHFTILSIMGLLVVLFFIYRSVWGILIPLTTVLISVVGSLGIMRLSGTPLNMMTTLLPIIMLVVGMSDVIHLVSKYIEEIRLKRDQLTALKNTLHKVGVATFLTSLTTALGFVTLMWVDMEPVRNFGLFTAVGVVFAFVLSILFIPSVFILIKKPKIAVEKKLSDSKWEAVLGKMFLTLIKHRKPVLWFYVLLSILSLYGASKIQFDYYLLQDLNEKHPLMQDTRFFQSEFGGLRPFELAIIPQGDFKIEDYEVIKEIEKLEEFLIENYGLSQVVSPSIPIKMMNKIYRNSKEEYFVIPPKEKRYNYLKKQLEPFRKKEVYQLMVSEDGKLGRINAKLVDPGSKEMLLRNEKLEKFVDAHLNQDLIKVRLTGTTVIIDESGRYVSQNVILGLFIAFFIIGLSMGLLFKSVKMAFLSLVPNLFPIVLTAGFIGFAGISLNMTTAIVFTISFGIAVDDTIHFLSRYRQELRSGKGNLISLRRTYLSTGKAILLTTFILLIGFGSLLLSDFLSTFYIGLFVCITLVFAVVTDLSLLPLILLKRNKS